MNYETKISELDEELESCERYIAYVDDNLKQLQDVIDEYNEKEKERCESRRNAEDLGVVVKLFQP